MAGRQQAQGNDVLCGNGEETDTEVYEVMV
jgi:hypothetical protein